MLRVFNTFSPLAQVSRSVNSKGREEWSGRGNMKERRVVGQNVTNLLFCYVLLFNPGSRRNGYAWVRGSCIWPTVSSVETSWTCPEKVAHLKQIYVSKKGTKLFVNQKLDSTFFFWNPKQYYMLSDAGKADGKGDGKGHHSMILTWLGMVGGGGQKQGLLNRGSAILWGKQRKRREMVMCQTRV